MLAATPPMGWNSWNTFGPNIDEGLVRETADAFVEHGLRDAGYEYVVIDDHWERLERDEDGRLVPDPEKFPAGMKALADYVHERDLKFGVYSCAGSFTCGGRPSSYGYEEEDARTFAEWGVDFLKYDFCYKPVGVDGRRLYERMGQALRAAGRPILFSMCEWGMMKPWLWGAARAGAHMWRTTGDINDSWPSVSRIGFEQQKNLHSYAGPGHWNDPDMLVVGMHGEGNVAAGGCTDEEYRTHFSLWCLLAAPLMMGCDVRHMSEAAREILTNEEAIAVNQDPLGRQAVCLGAEGGADSPFMHSEVWTKHLEDGSVAVGLFNRHDKHGRKIPLAWEALGIHDRRPCLVRDLWAHEDLGVHTRMFAGHAEPHACRLLRVMPQP
jgi:alpha-galactosidase